MKTSLVCAVGRRHAPSRAAMTLVFLDAPNCRTDSDENKPQSRPTEPRPSGSGYAVFARDLHDSSGDVFESVFVATRAAMNIANSARPSRDHRERSLDA